MRSVLLFVVVAAVVSVFAETDSVHVPLTRRGSVTPDLAYWAGAVERMRLKYGDGGLERRQSSADVPLQNVAGDLLYTGRIGMGTPPQMLNVGLDTGSADLWVSGVGCRPCTGLGTQYNPAASSTFNTTGPVDGVDITYASGEVIGRLSSDRVTMGGFTIDALEFALVRQTSSDFEGAPFSGLMGLGFQTISTSGSLPLWQGLLNAGQFSSPEFSFYLTRVGNDSSAQEIEPGGALTLGGTNRSLYTGEIDFVSMPTGYTPAFWLLQMTSLTISGQSIPVTQSTALSVIDTGTTLIGGPSVDVRNLYAAVPGSRPLTGPNAGLYAIPCTSRLNVSIAFGGRSWSITDDDMILQTTSSTVCVGAIIDLNANLDATGGRSGIRRWIIGDTFLKNVYSVFRATPPSVGFAQLVNGSPTTPSSSTPSTLIRTGTISTTPLATSNQSASSGGEYMRPLFLSPMPSLFSRSHQPDSLSPHPDEFGRVNSRSSARNFSKKDQKEEKSRQRTLSATQKDRPPQLHHPDGAFLPLNLDRPAEDQSQSPSYGYLAFERHVVLGLEQLTRLVVILTHELTTRGGVATPFIFSSLALDIPSAAIKRLIQAFLATCARPDDLDIDRRWREEAKFAGPYELGMALRWGLARAVRSVAGQDVRGLVAWEHYLQFRDSEAALNYPSSHFATFLHGLDIHLQSILHTLFALLARMTANSATSGHTPPTLSPLFGPLLFGLGPPTLAFHHTYIRYLWTTNATEHLILAYIRWQDTPAADSPSAASLGVPTRLKHWIRGYPSMLPFLKESSKTHKPQARKGARTVRVLSVRRNVRMYTSDLVRTAASWGQKPRPASGTQPNERGLASSKDWDRIAPANLRLPPRYSDPFKKRMDLPSNFHPDLGPGSNTQYSSDTVSTRSSGRSSFEEEDPFGLGTGLGLDRFRSLTDLKWGEFESMGFSELGDEKKLQFDLTEGARTARAAKRTTLSWNDFSSAGFSRGDVPLNATLQFSTPISTTISSWPAHNAEMTKKIKKTQRSLPPFGWDTEPIIGSEEVIEEAFVDVFCDLIYGGGWMDVERVEEFDRECNWALVEFKAMPVPKTAAGGAPAATDPRTATSLILFEEFVPLEYRQQLAGNTSSRKRLPSLFSSNKGKQWKPASTLNGRPYVVGHVPHIPSYREVEFEGLLRATADTKVISIGNPVRSSAISGMSTMIPPVIALTPARSVTRVLEKSRPKTATPTAELFTTKTTTAAAAAAAPPVPVAAANVSSTVLDMSMSITTESGSTTHHQAEGSSTATATTTTPSAKRLSLFKLPVVASPGGARKAGMTPAEYSTVEFETRVASYSDDDDDRRHGSGNGHQRSKRAGGDDDDEWMEILVATQDRGMGRQEAEFTRKGKGKGKGPEEASLEVARALAGVLDQKGSSDDEGGREGGFVDEVQLIPRRIDAYDGDYFSQPMGRSGPTYDQGSDTHDSSTTGQDDYGEPEPESERGHDQVRVREPEPEPEEDPEELTGLSYLQHQRAQRRLGYFDLHPERRQAIRADEEDEDEEDGFNPLVDSYVAPLVPRKVGSASSPQSSADDHDSVEDHRFGKRPIRLDSAVSNGATEGKGKGRATSTASPLLPTPPVIAPQLTGSGKKATALIEMYRERERGASAVPVVPSAPVIVAPSRLPVRALPTPPKEISSAPAPSSTTTTLAVSAPAPAVTPPPLKISTTTTATVESQLEPPPGIAGAEENGRSSPARYVHGAPLHNVLEEEEEEP